MSQARLNKHWNNSFPFRNAVIIVLIQVFAMPALARVCSSTGNGNWGTAATWSCTGIPASGDTVIIQAGHIVTLNSNFNYTGAPMHINVNGVWRFSGGGSKISLPCGSYVEIHPDGYLEPDPNNSGNSETVRICNVTYWNTTMGNQSGYTAWPGPPNPLFVELLSFRAETDGENVKLDWVTAMERESSHFLIYRSDGAMARTLAGVQPAAGHSTGPSYYSMLDAPSISGDIYYHLEEVDMDGTIRELAMAAVHLRRGIKEPLSCSPNPLNRSEALLVELPAHDRGIDVRLSGPSGRWLHPAMVEMDNSLVVVLDGLQIRSGMYTLQVMDGGRPLGTCRLMIE